MLYQEACILNCLLNEVKMHSLQCQTISRKEWINYARHTIFMCYTYWKP